MIDKALEMRNVSVVRDGKKILDSVNLEIGKGENVAIIGLNGSGKTTLMKLLRGEIHPYYDETDPPYMSIFGEENWNLFEVRNSMGVVSMDLQNMFRQDTKVYEVIASGFFGSMDIFRNMSVTQDMMEKVNDSATMMGIQNILDREIECLSLGEMRRALIARALVKGPDLLVLDEPMTGLDIVMKSKFRSMFDILIENGISIMMITHDLSDIPRSIDRVIMIKAGRLVADGKKEDLLDSKNISELYGESINVEHTMGIYRMYLAE